jgi:hypothetical protein
VRVEVVLGDARLTLGRAQERYGLIVVDAFSSDAIPLHLLTREALAVYRSRLTDDGILAFNVSNRYLNLGPVLADLAEDARPPMACLTRDDVGTADDAPDAGKTASEWVLLISPGADVGKLNPARGWYRLRGRPGAWVWTDDYSNLLSVIKWTNPQ